MQKKNKIILILILLGGLFLRLYQLNKEGFIIEEIYTFENCLMGIPSLIQYWFSEGHFPTYFIIMHYWMNVFGNTEFAMRFLSLIFGVLSIYAIYLLGKRLFEEKTGLLASFLLAVSILSIYYSQIARPYSMIMFFVIMSFLFLYDALEKNTRLCWIGYMFFTLFGLFLSVSALPMIICQMVFIKLLWSRYKKKINGKTIRSVFSLILLVYLPLLLKLAVSSFKYNKFIPLRGIEHPSFTMIVNMFNLFGGKIYMLGNTVQHFHFLIDILGIILFLLCLKGIFNAFNSHKEEESMKALYLSTWLVGPIVLLFVFSILVSPALGPVRYLLYISTAYYLLISKGIMSFKKRQCLLSVIFIMIMSFMVLNEYCYVLRYVDKRVSWRKLHCYIDSHIREGEKVAFSFYRTPALDVLFHFLSPSPVGVWSDKLPSRITGAMAMKITQIPDRLMSVEVIELEQINYEGIWFIGHESELNVEMVKLFKNKYDLIEEEKISDITLHHFRHKL